MKKADEGSKPAANGKAPELGNNSEIGRKLKLYYDELITEDVPDRFTDLLKQLERTESPASDGTKE